MNPDFLVRYANWQELARVHITVDIDFAPEYMIDHLMEQLQEYHVSATFFATHYSNALDRAANSPQFEIGSHPYLGPNSTQGENLEEIVGSLRGAYKGHEITGNRFHLLAYSYRDLSTLGNMGFDYDVSTLRYNLPYGLPVFHKDLGMVLLIYTWEDGVCENARLPMRLDSINLRSPGIKIINFHPMNVFINCPDAAARLKFQKENPDLLHCPRSSAEKYRQKGVGAAFTLLELLKYIKTNHIHTGLLKELAGRFKHYSHD